MDSAASRPVGSPRDRYAVEHPHGNWHVEKPDAACSCDPALAPDVTDAACPFHGVLAFLMSGAIPMDEEEAEVDGS